MIPPEDKRHFSRMAADCRLLFKPVDAQQPSQGHCINLSGSGILFETDMPVEPGKAVEIYIRPSNKITPPLNAFVEVLRCDQTGQGHFEIAAAIKGIKGE